MDGVERRPDLLAFAEAIEEVDRECAQISTLESGLAFAEFGDDCACILFEIFVAGGGEHQGTSRKIVAASVVAAKFAVGFLPAAEWLGRGGDSCRETEGMQQAVGREGTEKLAVGFHDDFAGSVAEADLLQWKGKNFPGNFLARSRLVFLRGVHDRILRTRGHQGMRQECRTGRRGCGGEKSSAGESSHSCFPSTRARPRRYLRASASAVDIVYTYRLIGERFGELHSL